MAAPHQTNNANKLGYGYIIQFYQNLLSTPAGSIPKAPVWIIQFEDLKGTVFQSIKKALTYEPGANTGSSGASWAIENCFNEITKDSYINNSGCLLCQAIDLPSQTTNTMPEGNINFNGFLRSYVGQGRVDVPIMRASFLETAVSFADNVLRPWSISTATFGLKAYDRSSDRNYRTNLYCWQLGSKDASTPVILKEFTFYDICCASVNNEELNYNPATGPVLREATFIYNYYTLKTYPMT